MPLLIAPLVAILIGVALAWVGQAGLRRHSGPVLTSKPFAVVLLFACLVELPCIAHVAWLHPDWGYMYVFPTNRIPSAVDTLIVLASTAATPGAFLLASRAAMSARFDQLFRVFLGFGGLVFLAALIGFRRLSTLATYAQFHGAFGERSVAGSLLGGTLVLSWLAMAAGIALCVRNLREGAREQ